MAILEKEEEVWDEYLQSLPEGQKQRVLKDGLCRYDTNMFHEKCQDGYYCEELWKSDQRRIMFLSKEGVGQAEEDYRFYEFSDKAKSSPHRMYKNIGEILYGLHTATDCNCAIRRTDETPVFEHLPFAICNLKKIPIKNKERSSTWKELREHTERNEKLLKKQIREVIRPRIIVCCGCDKDDSIAAIAKDYIFNDLDFKTFIFENDPWIYFTVDFEWILINSYHFSYRYIDNEKIIRCFSEFLNCYKPKNLQEG